MKSAIEQLSTAESIGDAVEVRRIFFEFRARLTRGEIRAAEKTNGRWVVNTWVKQGILLGFRIGELKEMAEGNVFSFVDVATRDVSRGVRVVGAGTVDGISRLGAELPVPSRADIRLA